MQNGTDAQQKASPAIQVLQKELEIAERYKEELDKVSAKSLIKTMFKTEQELDMLAAAIAPYIVDAVIIEYERLIGMITESEHKASLGEEQ